MLKKTLLVTLMASASTIITAPAMANTFPFNGFYVGGGASRDTAEFDTQNSYSESQSTTTVVNAGTPTTTSSNSGLNTSNDASGTGAGGNIFAGYGYTFDSGFYLGGEIFGGLSSLAYNSTNISNFTSGSTSGDATINSSMQLKNSYGISFLPGLMVTHNTLLYGRVGYVRSQFDLENSIPIANNNELEAGSENTSLNGSQLGIGLETVLTKHWSLRGEYTYTDYNSFNRSANASTLTSTSNTTTVGDDPPITTTTNTTTAASHNASVHISPTTNQFTLSVVYRFA